MIPIIILAIKCVYSKDYMTAICILTSSCLLLYTQTYSIIQCTSCIGDYDNYISDKELDTTYIKQVNIHQKYLFIERLTRAESSVLSFSTFVAIINLDLSFFSLGRHSRTAFK